MGRCLGLEQWVAQYRPFDELGLHGLTSDTGLSIVLVDRFAVIAVPERH